MDAAEYLPMFLAECRENLQELNLAIVRLEEHPEDRDTIDAIFRIAHSLKGMSGTMGFERMARLTHAMEDVFEVVRERHGRVEQEAIDVVLACLDALSGAVDALDAGGGEVLDPEPLIERLHGLVRAGDAEQEEPAAPATGTADLLARAGARRLLRVTVEVAEESPMPAVRLYMAYDSLRKLGEILAATPSEEDVETHPGRSAELYLATEAEDAAVASAARLVAEIASVDVDPLEPAAGASDGGAKPGGEEARRTPAEKKKVTSTTVRVDSERLDQLMHLMGELVVQRTRLEAIAAGAGVPGLSQAVQDLARSSQALQAMVMQVRMIPVEAVFLRFPRLVRDISTKLGKKVELTLTGQDTELDRSVVEALGDPLVHLVRNALDHGLEPPEERLAAGKPETGAIEISARHAGGSVLIAVRDDGRGIDPARVAAVAVKRGVIAPQDAEAVDMPRAIELLFAPGFSTAEQTTDLSGRGVGMDAVRTMVRSLGGDVVLGSELGVGTTAQVRLPLTLAIISALLVEACDLPFALPLERVERTFQLDDHVVRSIAGRRMLVLRDEAVPLIDLAASLGHGAATRGTHAVLVQGGDRRFALLVDALVGQRELVTRPLPDEVGRGGGFSGGAVLSDGEIALVVDCDAIAATVRAPLAAVA